METFFGIFEVIVNLFEYVLIFLLYNRQLRLPNNRRKLAIAVIFIGTALTTTLNFLGVDSIVSVLVLGAFDFLYAFLLFSGTKTMRVMCGIAPAVIFSVSEFITVLILSLFTDSVEEIMVKSTAIRFESQMLYISVIVVFFLAASSVKHKNEKYLPFFQRLFMIGLVAVCVFATSMLIKATLLLNEGNFSGAATICAVLSFVLFIICIGIIALFYSTSSVYQRNYDMQIAMQKAEYENKHTENLYDTYQRMRSWKHDTTSRLRIIKAFAHEGKNDEIVRFIGEAESEMSEFYSYVNTDHPAVDAVISNGMSIAKAHGITVRPVLLVPKDLPLGDMDMCSIFSNLLDNAIEAVDKIDSAHKKYIDLEVGTKSKMLFIQVINPSDGKYNFNRNGTLQTTKTDNTGMHGLGLARVKMLVEKAGGNIDISPENDKFCVRIMIPLKEVMS